MPRGIGHNGVHGGIRMPDGSVVALGNVIDTVLRFDVHLPGEVAAGVRPRSVDRVNLFSVSSSNIDGGLWQVPAGLPLWVDHERGHLGPKPSHDLTVMTIALSSRHAQLLVRDVDAGDDIEAVVRTFSGPAFESGSPLLRAIRVPHGERLSMAVGVRGVREVVVELGVLVTRIHPDDLVRREAEHQVQKLYTAHANPDHGAAAATSYIEQLDRGTASEQRAAVYARDVLVALKGASRG